VGLNPDDARPEGISFRDAYAAVRTWLQANVDRFAQDPQRGTNASETKPYIESLPPPEDATETEMQDALRRIIHSDLEWAYHEDDGSFKMAAYAWGAFDAAGVDPLRS
jgi:hypothetical protein